MAQLCTMLQTDVMLGVYLCCALQVFLYTDVGTNCEQQMSRYQQCSVLAENMC